MLVSIIITIGERKKLHEMARLYTPYWYCDRNDILYSVYYCYYYIEMIKVCFRVQYTVRDVYLYRIEIAYDNIYRSDVVYLPCT